MKRVLTYTELRERRRCAYRGHLAYDCNLTRIVRTPGLREGAVADKGMDALYEHVKATGEYSLDPMLSAMRLVECSKSLVAKVCAAHGVR